MTAAGNVGGGGSRCEEGVVTHTLKGDAAGLDFKGNCFEFLPFGSGHRSCPGMVLGLYTPNLTITHLAYSFNWCSKTA
ncbi:hypothetical protein GUJ93_ZPchr0010g9798 [Zizania palustris]|uniref:Cytochrome P450 n=1 Tax=Zizania palustris TaxID=103762 RepID=A0A8J5WCX7_ZIZPA|nr:hypothetical protein GUJ93_ZPchr0010g9798 [Zizania palustris]